LKNSNYELPLVLLGAGGFARELLGWMSRDSLWPRPIALVQDTALPGDTQLGVPVTTFEAISGPVRFLLAVSPPDLKERLVGKAIQCGWFPSTYVDTTALIGLDTEIGQGSIISPLCTVSTNAKLGEFVTLNCRSGVGHESVIGDYSTLLGSNQVNGNVRVGDRALLGAGSIIHPGRSIGRGATVGIGSVVLTHVKDGMVVFGNPAKRISNETH
jgi:acetyltransferase EpsM